MEMKDGVEQMLAKDRSLVGPSLQPYEHSGATLDQAFVRHHNDDDRRVRFGSKSAGADWCE
jgi:hypothetical protein